MIGVARNSRIKHANLSKGCLLPICNRSQGSSKLLQAAGSLSSILSHTIHFDYVFSSNLSKALTPLSFKKLFSVKGTFRLRPDWDQPESGIIG
jgi:hypothetical protein